MNLHDRPSLSLQKHIAPNKLKLLFARDSSNPIVSIQFYVKTGSAKERTDQHGYAHFLEHLVFKSTEKYSNNELSTVATEIGAEFNAYTDYDATCFYLNLPSANLDKGLEIISQMVCHPLFNKKDIEIEKQIILEEIYQYEAEPEMSFLEFIQDSYFVDSSLKHPILGEKSSVKKANKKSIEEFYTEHYTALNSFMVVCGDFDPDALKKSFNKLFSSMPVGKESRLSYREEKHSKWRSFSRTKNGMELIAIALPELPEEMPESELLHLAIRHLAIGKSCKLHKRLVEREKLCSSIRVSTLSGIAQGISIILFSPIKAEYQQRIISAFMQEWWQVLEKGIEAEELHLLKKDIIHSWIYSFDSVEDISNLIASEEFNNNLPRIFNYGMMVNSLNNEQLINALRRYWDINTIACFYQGKHKLFDASIREIDSYADKCRSLSLIKAEPLPKSESKYDFDTEISTLAISSYHHFVLSNGMSFVYNHLPNKDICAFALSCPLSQLNEDKAGANHFSSALMLYGSKQRSYEEIMRFSRERGLNIRVLHHLDSTIFRGKCHFSNLEDSLKLLSELILEPKFDKEYFLMLKNASQESIRRENDYSVSQAYKNWFYSLYGKKNNLLYPSGNLAQIKELKMDDIHQRYEDYLRGSRYSLCIAGSLEPELALSFAEEYFALKFTYNPIVNFNPRYEQTPPSEKRNYKKLDQAVIYVGGHACPAKEIENNTAFIILSQLMGGDLSSRLYSSLRERYGLAYQTGFDFSSVRDLGYWNSFVLCDPDSYLQSLKALKAELSKVCQNGIEESEFYQIRDYLVSQTILENESLGHRVASIANLCSLGYPWDYYLLRTERIAKCRINSVNKLAAKYLSPENYYTYIMV